MAAPPLPRHVIREMRKGFTLDDAETAKNSLVTLARSCADPKVRMDAAKYITSAIKEDQEQFFDGSPDALIQLSTMPKSQQTQAAMQMFANEQISRRDLTTTLDAIKADQSEVIELLRAQNHALEKAIEERRAVDATGGASSGALLEAAE